MTITCGDYEYLRTGKERAGKRRGSAKVYNNVHHSLDLGSRFVSYPAMTDHKRRLHH